MEKAKNGVRVVHNVSSPDELKVLLELLVTYAVTYLTQEKKHLMVYTNLDATQDMFGANCRHEWQIFPIFPDLPHIHIEWQSKKKPNFQ